MNSERRREQGRERKESETRRKRTIRKLLQGKTRTLTQEQPEPNRRDGKIYKLKVTSLVKCPLQPRHEIPPLEQARARTDHRYAHFPSTARKSILVEPSHNIEL